MKKVTTGIILWDEISDEAAIHYETPKGEPLQLDRDALDPKQVWQDIAAQLELDDGDEDDPTWEYVSHASTNRVTLMEGRSTDRDHLCTVQIIW